MKPRGIAIWWEMIEYSSKCCNVNTTWMMYYNRTYSRFPAPFLLHLLQGLCTVLRICTATVHLKGQLPKSENNNLGVSFSFCNTWLVLVFFLLDKSIILKTWEHEKSEKKTDSPQNGSLVGKPFTYFTYLELHFMELMIT